MLCHQCKEQIEVGEACKTEYLPGLHQRYFHPGCHMNWKAQLELPFPSRRDMEEAQIEDAEFERIAAQARTIC